MVETIMFLLQAERTENMEDKKNVPRTLQELSPGESGMILSVGNQSGAVKRRLVVWPDPRYDGEGDQDRPPG